MSTLRKIFISLLFSNTAIGIPQHFNHERGVSTTGNTGDDRSSSLSIKSSTFSPKASSVVAQTSSIRFSTVPPAFASNPSKSGCLYNVPGVGSFTQMSNFNFDSTTLPSGLQANAYTVNDDAPYTHSFTSSNVYVNDSFLNLLVPGKQTQSPIKCGEVQTTFGDILYASVRTTAIFSDITGTCAGIFFYKADTQEIDIEYLSDPSSLSNSGADTPPPLQYTNQATRAGVAPTHAQGPPPDDVTTLHEYRVDWVPGRTSFYLDGIMQKSFTANVPTQAGPWIWNHWTNGDPGFSVGPPQSNSIFKIQNIVMYYNRTSTAGTCGR